MVERSIKTGRMGLKKLYCQHHLCMWQVINNTKQYAIWLSFIFMNAMTWQSNELSSAKLSNRQSFILFWNIQLYDNFNAMINTTSTSSLILSIKADLFENQKLENSISIFYKRDKHNAEHKITLRFNQVKNRYNHFSKWN